MFHIIFPLLFLFFFLSSFLILLLIPPSSFRSLPGGVGSRDVLYMATPCFSFSYLSLCSFFAFLNPRPLLLVLSRRLPFLLLLFCNRSHCVINRQFDIVLLVVTVLSFTCYLSFLESLLTWRPTAGGDYLELRREGTIRGWGCSAVKVNPFSPH